nr:hypothetical protein [Tanacetum cinerariifolium]
MDLQFPDSELTYVAVEGLGSLMPPANFTIFLQAIPETNVCRSSIISCEILSHILFPRASPPTEEASIPLDDALVNDAYQQIPSEDHIITKMSKGNGTRLLAVVPQLHIPLMIC